MGQPEGDLQRAIQIAASADGHRLFRTQAGQAWVGKVLARTPHSVTLANPRIITLGPPGMSDLTGIQNGTGRYIALEVKTELGRIRKEQIAYLAVIERLGGIHGVARSVEQARAIWSE